MNTYTVKNGNSYTERSIQVKTIIWNTTSRIDFLGGGGRGGRGGVPTITSEMQTYTLTETSKIRTVMPPVTYKMVTKIVPAFKVVGITLITPCMKTITHK